jgi:hypothetical protein
VKWAEWAGERALLIEIVARAHSRPSAPAAAGAGLVMTLWNRDNSNSFRSGAFRCFSFMPCAESTASRVG